MSELFIGKTIRLDPTVEILNKNCSLVFKDKYHITNIDTLHFDQHNVEFIYCDNYIIIIDNDANTTYFGQCIHSDNTSEEQINSFFSENAIITHNNIEYQFEKASEFVHCDGRCKQYLIKLFTRVIDDSEEFLFMVVENGVTLQLYIAIQINKNNLI